MKAVQSEEIINNVKIITYDDESQHFETTDCQKPTIAIDNRSWWQKVCDWWNDAPVKPYVKVRDLADPTEARMNDIDDIDVGSDGKNAVEVGVKISF